VKRRFTLPRVMEREERRHSAPTHHNDTVGVQHRHDLEHIRGPQPQRLHRVRRQVAQHALDRDKASRHSRGVDGLSTHTCTHRHAHTHTRTHTDTHGHTRRHQDTHTHADTKTHRHTDTQTHRHTDTHRPPSSSWSLTRRDAREPRRRRQACSSAPPGRQWSHLW
jgi:hypothetical protein